MAAGSDPEIAVAAGPAFMMILLTLLMRFRRN